MTYPTGNTVQASTFPQNADVDETLEIAGRPIGGNAPAFVIAEVAQAHDGSLGAAHAFIDLAADCGADAIKFQTHIAAAESTRDEPFRVKFSRQDATRYDYWQRMEFQPEHWGGLIEHTLERGLIFLSSPFSLEAVAMLHAAEMPAWKVPSGEINNLELLDAMQATGRPLLLSSGMSSWSDLDAAVAHLRTNRAHQVFGLFQCTTRYPTPIAEVGLNVIGEMADRYRVPVGLSDHSGDIIPPIAAMTLGAAMIEVHICLHKGMFGPDTPASLTPDQLKEVCRARDLVHTMRTSRIEKDEMADALEGTRRLFSRSLALKSTQPAGTVLTREMFSAKKPGGGIPYNEADQYVGRRLARDISFDRILRENDFV